MGKFADWVWYYLTAKPWEDIKTKKSFLFGHITWFVVSLFYLHLTIWGNMVTYQVEGHLNWKGILVLFVNLLVVTMLINAMLTIRQDIKKQKKEPN